MLAMFYNKRYRSKIQYIRDHVDCENFTYCEPEEVINCYFF
jgi:hypothetical protein